MFCLFQWALKQNKHIRIYYLKMRGVTLNFDFQLLYKKNQKIWEIRASYVLGQAGLGWEQLSVWCEYLRLCLSGLHSSLLIHHLLGPWEAWICNPWSRQCPSNQPVQGEICFLGLQYSSFDSLERTVVYKSDIALSSTCLVDPALFLCFFHSVEVLRLLVVLSSIEIPRLLLTLGLP